MPHELKKLIEAAKKGDKNAYGEIYKVFLSRIYRFIYYLVYDESLAEDITQETFVRAWKAMPRFSSEKGTLQSYLFTIARNLVIDNQRKKKEMPLEGEAQAVESGEDLENSVVRKEEQTVVRKALNILEGQEKQIVILRYFEELSFSEIAGIVKKNEGTLRVAVHRALGKLKDFVEEGSL